MPRGREEMQVNVAGLRRNIKNLAHNYSDAQVKVREATSNDPWGPSSTLMAEIADLTYNVMAFTEIMQMVWKRLNDHGKNWRHVYKALVLLEYLLRTGSDRVALQCKENIYAIETLKDFQYMEEGKDQGLNVREKAKQLVILLKDEERLKAERERAMKAKQRFAQTATSFGSDGALDSHSHSPASPTYPALSESSEWVGNGNGNGNGVGGGGREAELARPLTAGEEELQLQLALAMSREEAEREERRRRSDDVRLQLALSQSQNDFRSQQYFQQQFVPMPSISEHEWAPSWPEPKNECHIQSQMTWWLYGCFHCLQQNVHQPEPPAEPTSHLLDLLDVNLSPPAPAPAPRAPPADSWPLGPPLHYPTQDTGADVWSTVGSPAADPWAPAPAPLPTDPWAPASGPGATPHIQPLLQSKSPTSVLSSPSSSELEQFDALSQRRHNYNVEPDPILDLGALDNTLKLSPATSTGAIKKSPSAFLGENSSLVNLERLLQPPAPAPAPAPGFAPGAPAPPHNPFAEMASLAHTQNHKAKPTINELKQQQMGLTGLSFPSASPAFVSAGPLVDPLTGPLVGPPGGADPWAPAPMPAPRGASPWSPQNQRQTPNPFLS